VKIELW